MRKRPPRRSTPTSTRLDDGGIAILPYASSDLEASTLAAIVAPDRFAPRPLTRYFRAVAEDAKPTRERRIYALAGLAGVGAPVLPEIWAVVADPELTVRERLIAGLGAATLGDATTARSVITSLVEEFGEAVDDHARLRVGDDAADITAATALMAMLMASTGDPVASRYRAYVQANPSLEAPYELHTVGYIRWALEHRPPASASFAYVSDGERRVVELGPGEDFRLKLTKAQLATLSIEPVEGAVGVTSSWREPVAATTFEKDPDVTIERRVRPIGTVRARDLVAVDFMVSFGPQAATGCHRVTDLVPSGLVPVGVLEDWMDPETGERPRSHLPRGAGCSTRDLLRHEEPERRDGLAALCRQGDHCRDVTVGIGHRRVTQRSEPRGYRSASRADDPLITAHRPRPVATAPDRRSGRDAEFLLGRLASRLHALAEVLELSAILEDGAGLLEHLALLLFHVVLDVLLHDLGLGAPALVVDRDLLELLHHQVDHVVSRSPRGRCPWPWGEPSAPGRRSPPR